MKALHICFMVVITFLWIWTLPLLIVASICMMPMAAVIGSSCLLITCAVQYSNDGHIIVDHWLRNLLSSIPWHEWFPCNQLSFDKGIVAVHPHGVLCCGALAGVHFVPKSKTCMCIAPIVFYVPVIGWMARHLGCIPADRPHMLKALGLGYPLVVVPGGVPEIVLAESGEDRNRYERHGFLRIAHEAHVCVHVVFVAGECSTYQMIKAPFRRYRANISRRLNLPLVFPLLLGWYCSWVPKRVPLLLKTVTVEGPTKKTYAAVLEKLYKK